MKELTLFSLLALVCCTFARPMQPVQASRRVSNFNLLPNKGKTSSKIAPEVTSTSAPEDSDEIFGTSPTSVIDFAKLSIKRSLSGEILGPIRRIPRCDNLHKLDIGGDCIEVEFLKDKSEFEVEINEEDEWDVDHDAKRFKEKEIDANN